MNPYALLPADHIRRLVAADGKIESGSTANPKTMLINPAVHVRIVGEGKTLCGLKLTPDYSTRWQWYGRGEFGKVLPHAMRDAMGLGDRAYAHDACKHCAVHPVVTETIAGEDAIHAAYVRERVAAQKKRERLDRQRDARRRRREAAAA